MYRIGSISQIVLDSGINVPALTRDLGRLRAGGLPIVPTLANIDAQGNWAYQPVARMLHDPALMARHVAAIVALVERPLLRRDRHRLRGAAGRRPAGVHCVRDPPGRGAARQGQDPVGCPVRQGERCRIRPAQRRAGLRGHRPRGRPGPADGVRLPLESPRRPAPSRRSAGSARSCGTPRPRCRRSKIILGIPFYGYDWVGDHGTSVTWMQAVQLARSLPRPDPLRRIQPGTLVRLHRRRGPPAHRVVRGRRKLPGEVQPGPGKPGSAASTCGCTATRIRAPGRRCGRCCQRACAPAIPAVRGHVVMPWWALALLVFGANFTLWGTVGLGRLDGPGGGAPGAPAKASRLPG